MRTSFPRLSHVNYSTRLWAFMVVGALLQASCAGERQTTATYPDIATLTKGCASIPDLDDWIPAGHALDRGAEGDFDRILWGGFAGAAVILGTQTLLYYQGSTGYSSYQESVTHRSVGLAVSADGLDFRKHASNPVLQWLPTMGEEEGAASIGIAKDPDGGELVAFYGANTRSGDTSVTADARWATSVDGRSFIDQGIALDHRDPDLFGARDEIFPVIALNHGGNWFVYYIPNGSMQKGQLGVAWGTRPDALTNNAGVTAHGARVQVWGMQSAVHLCGDIYAFFLNDVREKMMTVYLADLQSPDRFSQPVAQYDFPATNTAPDFLHGIVLLNREGGAWHMYYRTTDSTGYRILRSNLRSV